MNEKEELRYLRQVKIGQSKTIRALYQNLTMVEKENMELRKMLNMGAPPSDPRKRSNQLLLTPRYTPDMKRLIEKMRSLERALQIAENTIDDYKAYFDKKREE